MKGIILYLRKLFRSLLFKRSLIQFGLFFAVVATFALLTSNHVITRTPQRIVPAEYAVIAEAPAAIVTPVELEQALRNKAPDVNGLVLFDGLKTVVVLRPGLTDGKDPGQKPYCCLKTFRTHVQASLYRDCCTWQGR